MILEILISAHKKMKMAHLEQKPLTPDMLSECFASIQTCVTNIRNSNTFMLMTINRCIDYTKASKGMKLVPKYETVDVREALQFPIECMSNIQERIGIKVEALSEEICSHIITDKQWLQENLLCLLSNAVKYSTEGSVTIKGKLCPMITEVESKSVSLFTRGSTARIVPTVRDGSVDEHQNSERVDCLVFEVEDTGIGVSEEAMKHLFNPFKQAQRLAGGTGLGLYSLAKRMEALKGRYGVRVREDGKQGSLFWFSIPYKADEVVAAASKEMAYEGSRREASRTLSILEDTIKSQVLAKPSQPSQCKGRRGSGVSEALEILIVDDTPSILKMSSMMLKRQGHEIWTAENGEIALKRMEEKWRVSGKGFDLVLMDLQMPVMDGLEATRRLRGMELEGREWMVGVGSGLGVKVQQLIIGVSANSDYDTSCDALAAGMNDFFSKPFALETFNKALAKHLQNR